MAGDHHRSVCITFAGGCPRAEMDTALLFPFFKRNGWQNTDRMEEADLVVVSGCGFDAKAEADSISLLSVVNRRRKPDSQLIILGCLAGIADSRLRREFGGAAIVTPRDLDRLDELLGARVRLRDLGPVNHTAPSVGRAKRHLRYKERHPGASHGTAATVGIRSALGQLARSVRSGAPRSYPFQELLRALDGERHEPVFCIRVARGCSGECTYCAIRSAVGPLRSKPLDAVMAEFEDGLAKGYRLFSIIAEDLGAYGTDIGTDVVVLLRHLFRREGSHRFLFRDVNVRHIVRHDAAMEELLAANRQKVSMLIAPVQSGSERILSRMRRGYTAAQALTCLRQLRQAADGMRFETHVLVGFPGETEEDFLATLRLLEAVRFDLIQVYVYSHRPGTTASGMEDTLTDAEKEDRARRVVGAFRNARIY